METPATHAALVRALAVDAAGVIVHGFAAAPSLTTMPLSPVAVGTSTLAISRVGAVSTPGTSAVEEAAGNASRTIAAGATQ
jgi:hypothetical protein